MFMDFRGDWPPQWEPAPPPPRLGKKGEKVVVGLVLLNVLLLLCAPLAGASVLTPLIWWLMQR